MGDKIKKNQFCGVESVFKLDGRNDFIRFIYFTDTHYNASSPENRKDNLVETALIKTQEIVELGWQHDIDFMLIGGDFFHRPDVTDLYAGRVADIYVKAGVPIFVVPGGHDTFGNNVGQLRKSKLGLLSKSGLFHLLIHPEKDRVIIENKGLTLQLTGTASNYGMDYEHIEEDYVIKYKDADYAVHVPHGMLMPKAFIPGAKTVFIDQIKHTLADMTLGAHYHIGFDPVEVDGKIFINPGAMVRRTSDLKEIDRIPKVVLVTIDREGIKYELIPLKTARPGNEVLDRTEIERKIARRTKNTNFVKRMKQDHRFDSIDIKEIIRKLWENKKLPEKVVQTAIEEITRMQQLLEPQTLYAKDLGYIKYLKRLTLINFRSYENVTIEFDKGINAFVGESGKGKTNILRALALLFYNEPRGNRYVRRGAKECRVIGEMSDGYVVERIRIIGQGSRPDKNIYKVWEPDGTLHEFENFGQIPDKVLEATGVVKTQIDVNKTFALNQSKQLDAPFLISESGTIKSKAIGSLIKTNILDAAEREIQKKINSTNSSIREITGQLKENEKKLEKYKDIDKKEKLINRYGELIERLKEINEDISIMKKAKSRIDDIKAEIEHNKKIIEKSKSLSEMEILYLKAVNLSNQKRQLTTLANKIRDVRNALDNCNMVIDKYIDIDSMTLLFDRARETYDKKRALEKKKEDAIKQLERISNIRKECNMLKRQVNSFKGIEKLEEKLKKAEELMLVLEKLEKHNNRFKDIKGRITKGREYIKNQDLALGEAGRKYKELLKQVGRCPFCNEEITDEKMEEILTIKMEVV